MSDLDPSPDEPTTGETSAEAQPTPETQLPLAARGAAGEHLRDVEPTAARTHQPSRKDRLRPAELLILAGVMGLFTGLVVLMATREPVLAVVALGVAFIAAVVGLAMFSLTFKPNPQEATDIDEQNREG